MKVTITYDGTLVVTAETEIEAFALKHFAEQWRTGVPHQPAIRFEHEWTQGSWEEHLHA